jgi:hypothetical protein
MKAVDQHRSRFADLLHYVPEISARHYFSFVRFQTYELIFARTQHQYDILMKSIAIFTRDDHKKRLRIVAAAFIKKS